MTPPTLRQRVRSAIRMFARAEGDDVAAWVALSEAVQELGAPSVHRAIVDLVGRPVGNGAVPVPAQTTTSEITRGEAETLLHDVARAIEEEGNERFADQVRDAIDVLVNTLPPVMGAKDAAEMLGMAVPNLRKLSPPLEPVEVVSGRIPLFLRSDVEAVARRRAAR
jgi:hypothetical protein